MTTTNTVTTAEIVSEAHVKALIENQITVADAVGLDSDQLEHMYAIGYQLFLQHRFADSHPILQLLAICQPNEGRYWNALAACRQMLGDFFLAGETYVQAAKCELDQVEPAVQAAFCLIRAEEADAAEAWLDEAQRRADESKENARYEKKFGQLRRAIGHLKETVSNAR